MLPAGFEPATPASDRPQTFALDLSATGVSGFESPTFRLVAQCLANSATSFTQSNLDSSVFQPVV